MGLQIEFFKVDIDIHICKGQVGVERVVTGKEGEGRRGKGSALGVN